MFVSCMTLFKDFFLRDEHGNIAKHPAKWATDEETEERKDEPRIFAKYDEDPNSLTHAAVVSYRTTTVVKLTGPNMHGKAEEVVDKYKNILRSELEEHLDKIVAAICNVEKLQAVASEESIEFVTEGDNFGEKDGIFTLALPMIIGKIRKLPSNNLKTRVIIYKSAPRSKAAHHNPAFLEWESALGTDYSAENLYMAYVGHDDDEKTKTWKTTLTYDTADVVVNIGSFTPLGVRKDGSKSIGLVETEEMVEKSTRTPWRGAQCDSPHLQVEDSESSEFVAIEAQSRRDR